MRLKLVRKNRKNVGNAELNINMQTTEVKKYVYIISLKKIPKIKVNQLKTIRRIKQENKKKLPLFFVLKNTSHIS